MAALAASQIMPQWADGKCDAFMVFAVKNVNTGDTIDMSPYYRVIDQQVFIGATVSGVAQGTVAGTTITAPTGLTNAGAFLFVQGVPV